jgi:hypothetical protein
MIGLICWTWHIDDQKMGGNAATLSIHNHEIKKMLKPLLVHKFLFTFCVAKVYKTKTPALLKKKHFAAWHLIEDTAIDDWAHLLNVIHRWSKNGENCCNSLYPQSWNQKDGETIVSSHIFVYFLLLLQLTSQKHLLYWKKKHFAIWSFMKDYAINDWAHLLNMTHWWSKMGGKSLTLCIHNHEMKNLPLFTNFCLLFVLLKLRRQNHQFFWKQKYFATWCFKNSVIDDWSHLLNATHRLSKNMGNAVTPQSCNKKGAYTFVG